MKEEKKICPICGKEFTNGRRKYCSEECTKESNRRNTRKKDRERDEKLKKRPKTMKKKKGKKLNALELTAKAAREAGMTYGQYVAQHNA